MNVQVVCEHLGKFEWEVLETMTPDEFARVCAYLNWKAKEEEKRARQAQSRIKNRR